MAGFRSLPRRVDVFDDADSIDDWMLGRSAQVAGREENEAAGREAWEGGTRNDVPVAAPRPGDLIALGARTAQLTGPSDSTDEGQAPASVSDTSVERAQPIEPDGPLMTPPRLRFVSAKPGDSISSLVGSSDPAAIGRFLSLNNMDPGQTTIRSGLSYVVPTSFDDASHDEVAAGDRALTSDNRRLAAIRADQARRQADSDRWAALLMAGRNIWTGEPVRAPPPPPRPPTSAARPNLPPRRWWDDSPLAKEAGGAAAEMVGRDYGVVRAGEHAAEGLGTAARLLNPLDPWLSAPGDAAWDQVTRTGRRIGSGIVRRVRDPSLLAGDLNHANVALNPDATPMANTFGEELGRRFHIGANQGELAANIAAIPLGGEVGSALEAMEYAGEAGEVGKYLRMGYSDGQAIELAKPYVGMGHHVKARRIPVPNVLGSGPILDDLFDSRLFVLKPAGIDKGQFYRLHYGVDDHFSGAKIPGYGRGQGYSGKKLGLPRYQGLERAWRGTTGYAKGVTSGAALDLGDDLNGAVN